MYNISVYGSCVSRDVFNSRFVPDYKEHFHLVCDQQHVSLISLMSPSIDINTDNLEGDVSPFYKEVFRQDMNKSYLNKLIETKPDWLMMDFYTDAYYGACLLHDGIYMTNKLWQYKKLNAFDQLQPVKSLSFEENTLEFLHQWKKAFDAFVFTLSKLSSTTKIVVNKAKFIDNLMVDGEVSSLSSIRQDPFRIDRVNYVWSTLDDYALSSYGFFALDFDKKKYHLSNTHPWGRFYVHYDDQYYMDVKKQLLDIFYSN